MYDAQADWLKNYIIILLHNYFDALIKLFSALYLAKFLDLSKPFFPCTRSEHALCAI